MSPFVGEIVNESLASPTSTTHTKRPLSKFHLQLPSTLPRSYESLEDRLIDKPDSLNVAIIGAGIAGLQAGIILPQKVPGIRLTIFEKNADVGGTWFENIYPGVRCDVPAHSYQSSYDPNIGWTEEFAQGPEIKAYWQGQARKHGIYGFARFNQRVTGLSWDEEHSTWVVDSQDVNSGSTNSAAFDFVVTAIGRFNAWKLPDYPGISEYKGVLRHTSNWDPTFEPAGKKIAIIGNGASGIQLVANIQPHVARLDHYARNKTWIATSYAGDETSIKPKLIPQELRDGFKDPDTYLAYRAKVEETYWRDFTGSLKGSENLETLRARMIQYAKENTPAELFAAIIPDVSPHCRRLTPGPGYFEAITAPNASYIQQKIRRFTATGIETEDGTHREVDAVFCATGANVDMAPPFPVRALGQNLPDLWREGGAYGFPYTYLGLATPGFPNLLFVQGPNGAARGGPLPHAAEIQVTALAKVLRKASREGIRAIAPSQRAADDFVQCSDAFFNTTVLSENCSSWYNGGKAGSRIHGLWPGSAAHMSIVLRDLRWEDWDYEYKRSGSRFAYYFGKGYTRKETDLAVDMTNYLQKPGATDLKSLHEEWWKVL